MILSRYTVAIAAFTSVVMPFTVLVFVHTSLGAIDSVWNVVGFLGSLITASLSSGRAFALGSLASEAELVSPT